MESFDVNFIMLFWLKVKAVFSFYSGNWKEKLFRAFTITCENHGWCINIYTAEVWIQNYRYLVFPLVDVQIYNDCGDVQLKSKCPEWIFKLLSCQKYIWGEKILCLLQDFSVIILHFFPEVSQHPIYSILFPAEMRLQQTLLSLPSRD